MIDSNTNVIVILDTDTVYGNVKEKEKLIKNLDYLIKNANEVLVITEDKNLEDELVRSIKTIKNEKDLYARFNETTKSDYKSRVASLSIINLGKKLNDIDLQLFWNRRVLGNFSLRNDIMRVNKSLQDVKDVK